MAWFEDIKKEKNHPNANEHKIKRTILNQLFRISDLFVN